MRSALVALGVSVIGLLATRVLWRAYNLDAAADDLAGLLAEWTPWLRYGGPSA